jgi:serine phosphatase RsbU (regulator of sigma subunit)/HD-like signal output (HDOD) protein
MTTPILAAIKQADNLPSLPSVALEILQLTRDENTSFAVLARTVEKDPALAGKILRIANSAFFGLAGQVSTIQQGISVLGLRAFTIQALGFSLIEFVKKGTAELDYESYWRHALTGSVAARLLAEHVAPRRKDEAFVGGLIMDIGIIAAATTAKRLFEPVMAEWQQLGHRDVEVETRHLGVSHATMSREVLSTWGLPDDFCRAIGAHLGDGIDDLAEEPRQLALLLRAASNISAIHCGDVAPEHLETRKQECVSWTGIGEGQLDQCLEVLAGQVQEMSSVLKVKIGRMQTYEEIRNEATRKLVELSVQAERESAEMKRRVTLAGERQQHLLPQRLPNVEGCSFGFVNLPAERLSGDFCGFVEFGDGRLGFFVGDCTGHGVEAGTVMGAAKKAVEISLRHAGEVGEGLRAANREIHPDMARGTFVTVLACIYNPNSRILHCARAGHNLAILCNPARGATMEIGGKGIPLGIQSGPNFDRRLRSESIPLQPGDLLLLYTDGLSESAGSGGEEYGVERIKEQLRQAYAMRPQTIVDTLVADAERFRQGPTQADDITMIAMMVAQSANPA